MLIRVACASFSSPYFRYFGAPYEHFCRERPPSMERERKQRFISSIYFPFIGAEASELPIMSYRPRLMARADATRRRTPPESFGFSILQSMTISTARVCLAIRALLCLSMLVTPLLMPISPKSQPSLELVDYRRRRLGEFQITHALFSMPDDTPLPLGTSFYFPPRLYSSPSAGDCDVPRFDSHGSGFSLRATSARIRFRRFSQHRSLAASMASFPTRAPPMLTMRRSQFYERISTFVEPPRWSMYGLRLFYLPHYGRRLPPMPASARAAPADTAALAISLLSFSHFHAKIAPFRRSLEPREHAHASHLLASMSGDFRPDDYSACPSGR